MAAVETPAAPDDDDFAWDDLLDAIEARDVVPVVGQEALAITLDGRDLTLQRLLAERVAASRGLPAPVQRHFELAEVAAAMLLPGVHPEDPYRQVWRKWREIADTLAVPVPLQQLASIQAFDLFVSTTPDDLLARALDQVRFRGSTVTRRLAFSVNQSTSAQMQAMAEPARNEAAVFHLFGQLSIRPEYVLHEEDALEFIHGLISRDAPRPEWLMSRLRESTLLFVGVHLPDWLERFVLRNASRDRLQRAGRVYYVAREQEPSAAAVSLFMHRFGTGSQLRTYPGDAAAFVASLQRRWQARQPAGAGAPAAAPSPRGRGAVFISYDRQNAAAVERLHAALVELGVDVWYDREDLAVGSDWHREILGQIRERVQLFLAIVSDQTERKPGSSGVVFEEWREGFARARRFKKPRDFFLPVVVDADVVNPDPRRYPSLLATFPEFGALNFGTAPNGVPSAGLEEAIVAQVELIRMAQG